MSPPKKRWLPDPWRSNAWRPAARSQADELRQHERVDKSMMTAQKVATSKRRGRYGLAHAMALVVLAIVTSAAAPSTWGNPLRPEIVIAAAGPMSGRYAAKGESLLAGVKLAVADINAGSGLRLGNKHFQLKLLVIDDACDAAAAARVAARLVAAKSALVVGHVCAAASIAAARIYATSQTIQIAAGTGHPRFSDERAGPGIFRLSGRDDQQGIIAGRYLAKTYRGGMIAIVHDNTLAAMALTRAATQALRRGGINEIFTTTFRPGNHDYRTLLGKLKRHGVAVLYIAGYATEVGLIVRQIAAEGLPVTVMSNDTIAEPQFLSAAQGAAEGTLLTLPPDPSRLAPAAKLIARLRAKKRRINLTALSAFAAVQAWRQAAENVGSTDKALVAANLSANRFDTVLGPLSFDAKGDANVAAYAIYRWSNGAPEALGER